MRGGRSGGKGAPEGGERGKGGTLSFLTWSGALR
jgi:hypothetical protein